MTTVALSSAGSAQRSRHHRWKVLGVGVAANASFSAAFSGIPTTAVFIRSAYHLGNAELGIALGLLGLGIAISELPWGLLTDRWGDRAVLLAGLGLTALALFGDGVFRGPHAWQRAAADVAGGWHAERRPAGRQREWVQRPRGHGLVP